MARGRPPDEHRLRVIKAPHVKRTLLQGSEDAAVEPTPITPDPPDWLAPYAKDEWRRVARELHEREWVSRSAKIGPS